MGVTETHEERETLAVDIYLPGHAPRVTTSLFRSSRAALLARDGERCYICQCGPDKVGPLEAHHFPIERSLAELVDWGAGSILRQDFPFFDWLNFDRDPSPDRIYRFVDDMLVNGKLLCKAHHIGRDEGIHAMPHPLWIAQRYAREGYKFSPTETIHHEEAPPCMPIDK